MKIDFQGQCGLCVKSGSPVETGEKSNNQCTSKYIQIGDWLLLVIYCINRSTLKATKSGYEVQKTHTHWCNVKRILPDYLSEMVNYEGDIHQYPSIDQDRISILHALGVGRLVTRSFIQFLLQFNSLRRAMICVVHFTF